MAEAAARPREAWRNLVAFWVLGFVNNIGYVVMIAGAQEIAAGGVGLVYFFDIFPALAVKLSGPYWFQLVSYGRRTGAGALLMLLSFLVVARGSRSLALQLLGVALSGLQSGMMEASFLAMASLFDRPEQCLTCWASGTGLAGVGGYAWVALLHLRLGLSFAATLELAAALFPLLYLAAFALLLDRSRLPPARACHYYVPIPEQAVEEAAAAAIAAVRSAAHTKKLKAEGQCVEAGAGAGAGADAGVDAASMPAEDASTLSVRDKLRFIATLGPYIGPLAVVYFAEYTMQTGVWSAIGFPVHSAEARARFYSAAGLAYQTGVFVSRSSGALLQASRAVLFLMPALQLLLLAWFTAVAALHFWYNWSLLALCLTAGLLGGGVYVNAFTLLSREVAPSHVELALAAASVGDTVGVMLADCAGLLLQGCLYSVNRLPGAAIDVQC